MLNWKICGDCMFDSSAVVNQLRIVFRNQAEAERFSFYKRVERAAVSNIKTHDSQVRHLNPLLFQVKERRHVAKRCFAYFPVCENRAGMHSPGGHIEYYFLFFTVLAN